MMTASPDPSITVLRAYSLEKAEITPVLGGGNINRTYRVQNRSSTFILQWLNPIFSPEIHIDIDAVTDILSTMGMLTPRLIRTTAGRLWATDEDGGVWRLMTCIDGITYMRPEAPDLCYETGKLLGQFHRILGEIEYAFAAPRRLGIHDTEKHLENLRQAILQHPNHPSHREVSSLAERIFQPASKLHMPSDLPNRLVHGDPKIANFLFSKDRKALALIDLDTLNHMSLGVEMGDALRSWCNPKGENDVIGRFELEWFKQSLRGYQSEVGDFITKDEVRAITVGTELITLELAARFAADALQESYFGWDKSLYPSATAHNLARANTQLTLAESFATQRTEAEQIVQTIFGVKVSSV